MNSISDRTDGNRAALKLRRAKLTSRVASALLLLALFFASGATEAGADPLTITFNNEQPGITSHLQYLSQGLVLVSGVNNPDGSFGGFYSGFRVAPAEGAGGVSNAAFGSVFPNSQVWRSLQGSFHYTPTQRATTSFLSFDVVGAGSGLSDSWRAVIYDIDGKQLDAITGTTNGPVVFSREMFDIATFVFFAASTSQGIDNVTFEAIVVPEPSTLILLATGLSGGLASLARRRKTGSARERRAGNTNNS